MSTIVVAEAGVNHNGSLELALELVDAAAGAGADYVKFQTFRADRIAAAAAPKAEYQRQTTGGAESQLEMLRKLELSEAAHRALIARCAERGIKFLSTPFDLESVELLARRLKLPLLKLPSPAITDGPLLLAAARTGLPLIVSTGNSTIDEIEDALALLCFGFVNALDSPGSASAREAYQSREGKDALRSKVRLLHCTSEYPAPFEEANLRAMATLRERFGLEVGLSDHTIGISAPIAAVAMGAVVIEKHFTIARGMAGPDHRASLEPGELRLMIEQIRQVETALGTGVKAPTPSELRNRAAARKSLVAAAAIRAGEKFTEANLAAKRPGTGISPMRYWELLGKTAGRDYAADDLIEPGDAK